MLIHVSSLPKVHGIFFHCSPKTGDRVFLIKDGHKNICNDHYYLNFWNKQHFHSSMCFILIFQTSSDICTLVLVNHHIVDFQNMGNIFYISKQQLLLIKYLKRGNNVSYWKYDESQSYLLYAI